MSLILNDLNLLNTELNPICYLLSLLAHHFLHVSRIRIKSLTLRLLMSYIYIYIYGAPILDVSRSHTTTHHSRYDSSGRMISSSQRPLTTHDTHNRQISMPPVGFEPTISADERPAAARLLRSWVRIPPRAWIFVCCECRVLSGRGLYDELITSPEEFYRLFCVVVCDLEISRIGAPDIYIYIYIYLTLEA